MRSRCRARPSARWQLARQNYAVQREPADARILLEAALGRAAARGGRAGAAVDGGESASRARRCTRWRRKLKGAK